MGLHTRQPSKAGISFGAEMESSGLIAINGRNNAFAQGSGIFID